jgi:hypothetical protein
MYKVTYYLSSGSNQVVFKWFKDLSEATTFANQRPIESVIEIKHYESDELIKSN